MIRYRVNVVQYFIDIGARLTQSGCPVARALSHATGKVAWIFEGPGDPIGSVYILGPIGFRRVGVLPQEVLFKILHYDLGGEMKPFTFEVSLEVYR